MHSVVCHWDLLLIKLNNSMKRISVRKSIRVNDIDDWTKFSWKSNTIWLTAHYRDQCHSVGASLVWRRYHCWLCHQFNSYWKFSILSMMKEGRCFKCLLMPIYHQRVKFTDQIQLQFNLNENEAVTFLGYRIFERNRTKNICSICSAQYTLSDDRAQWNWSTFSHSRTTELKSLVKC